LGFRGQDLTKETKYNSGCGEALWFNFSIKIILNKIPDNVYYYIKGE